MRLRGYPGLNTSKYMQLRMRKCRNGMFSEAAWVVWSGQWVWVQLWLTDSAGTRTVDINPENPNIETSIAM